MSFILNKKKFTFCPNQLEEGTGALCNPSRGWYQIHTFSLDVPPDFDELYWSLEKEDAIVLAFVGIGAFRDTNIPDDALARLSDILTFLKEQEREVILRIAYDRLGCGMEAEPAFFDTVTEHMRQLGAVIRRFSGTVLVVQGMLLGSWGEMHDSRFLSAVRLKKLFSVWREALSDAVPFAVRTPKQWRLLHKEGEISFSVGLFDDGMFGSDSNLGTYGTISRKEAGWSAAWRMEEEIDFTGMVGAAIPFGGEAVRETCSPGSGSAAHEISPEETVERLRRTNVCYLNRIHDPIRLNQWRKTRWQGDGVWNGKSMFDYIGAHLGYRFLVTTAKPGRAREAKLRVCIVNQGFTSIKEETELLLCMDRGQTETVALPYDLKGLAGGQMLEAEIALPKGEYTASLKLRRKRDQRAILFANVLENGGVLLGKVAVI